MGVRNLLKLNKSIIIYNVLHVLIELKSNCYGSKEERVQIFSLDDPGKLKKRGHFSWVLEDIEEYARQKRERERGFHVKECGVGEGRAEDLNEYSMFREENKLTIAGMWSK